MMYLGAYSTHVVTNSIFSDNGGSAYIMAGGYSPENITTTFMTINGNVEGHNDSENTLVLWGPAQLEVNGEVISQGDGTGSQFG